MIGQLLGMVYAVLDTARYKKVAKSSPGGRAPPEAWLAPSLVGAVALPVGLFWFAWTNGANIHWAVSLVGIMPFGFGQVLVFLSINQYLIDAYSVYAASTLAANASVRALFGAALSVKLRHVVFLSTFRDAADKYLSTVPFSPLQCTTTLAYIGLHPYPHS